MHLVAIAELKGSLDTPKLNALAKDLETTAYELRLLLNAGLPAVVVVTADPDQARRLYDAIIRHEHIAARCDRDVVVPSAKMTTLRHFQWTPTQLVADSNSPESCPWENVSVMLRATHRTTRETIETVKERQFQPSMALATGGLVMSKKITKEVTTTTASREQVCYLFRKSGHTPWLLRERSASYGALGTAMAPSSFENFAKTVAQFRAFAPSAVYDERLLVNRPIRGVGDGSDATDLLAYLLTDYYGQRTNG
jgi:hypothetical protein